jgi:hypothetical protein
MFTAVIFLPSAGLALGKDFAECRFLALGKEIFADKIFAERPLPSAALGKAFAECLADFAECQSLGTRQSRRQMFTAVIFLPSAGLECRFLALGKEIFADKIFAERPLPSAALGKAFAECLAGFAECPQH